MLSIFTVPLLALCSVSASKPTAESTPSPVIAAWYTSLHDANEFPLSSVSWGKYNTLYYSFVTTTSSADSISLDDSHADLLPLFVSNAQSHGVQAHVAVGGWLGTVWFSSSIVTAEKRTAFVKTLADFVQKYKLDGIQFDWEYPGMQDVGCNTISADETSNYLEFLQELRKDPVGEKLTLSAAVSLAPFTDASGKTSADISGFAQVFDYITLMNYDVWGPWSKHVGPNAPLNDTCASPENRQGSAVSAIKAWTAAGMPINKIVLGVASFGRSFSVSPSDAFKSDKKTRDEPGKTTSDESGEKTPDEPGNTTSDESGEKTPDEPGKTTSDESGEKTPDEPGKTTSDESGEKTPDEPGKTTSDESGEKTPDEPGKTTSDESDEETSDESGEKTPDELGVKKIVDSAKEKLAHFGKKLAEYPAFDASKQPPGDAWDHASSVDVCGGRHGPGGTFRFRGLVDAGFLNKDGKYADGIHHTYHECSHTPYAYNEKSHVMISFDNAHSFAVKGRFIKETGLRGFAMWEAAGDYDDILLDSIRKAMGIDEKH